MSQSRGSNREKDELSGHVDVKPGSMKLAIGESPQSNVQVNLKESKIASLPTDVFKKFTLTQVLDIRKNVIERLPSEISVMVNLEELYVDHNRLGELPPEVCELPKLKTLSTSQNLLTELPSGMGRMTYLKTLVLGDNLLSKLPPELSECKALTSLYAHHNHFMEIPTSLHQLTELTELALEWFRYTTPPLPRLLKGSEWRKVIEKFRVFCRSKFDQGIMSATCTEMLSYFSQKVFDIHGIDSMSRTRLHVACLEGHVGVAKGLLQSGAKYDTLECEGYSPLLIAVREGHSHAAAALVKAGADVNRGGGLFGSPLHVATVNFSIQLVSMLIRGGADANQTDADGNTPLHVLMSVFDRGSNLSHQIGQLLLKYHADCNRLNSDNWAPLHLAARRGQLNGISFVLSHAECLDPACREGTQVHLPSEKQGKSAKTNSFQISSCSRSFDVNVRGGSHRWTALHLAGHAGHLSVVQGLVDAGADVFLRNIDGRTCRQVSRGNLAISKLMRKMEDEWLWFRIHQPSSPSKDAPASGMREPLEQLSASASPSRKPILGAPDENVSDDMDLESIGDDDSMGQVTKNIRIKENINGLVEVTGSGEQRPPPVKDEGQLQRRTSRALIAKKCLQTRYSPQELQHVQSVNFNFRPPTSVSEFATLFLQHAQSGRRHRLLFLLSKQWAKELCGRLLKEEGGDRIMMHAAASAHEDALRILLGMLPEDQRIKLGAVRNADQETMLHVMCKSPSSKAHPALSTRADLLAFLLGLCPMETFDLEARDVRGQTALHVASQFGDLGLVQVLLENGANPNSQEETTGWTPLHFAVSKSYYSVILQLLHHDATKVNQVDKFDWPPLLESCSRLDARAVALLVNGGACLEFQNQHQFDILKAADTSKKDLAAKRWMLCLLVSNGFRFEKSSVQLTAVDTETLRREREFFDSRRVSASSPPFFVPDHLAPRCHSCKVLFSVTVRRSHCRSCGLVLCGNCAKVRPTRIVCLDERVKSRQNVAKTQDSLDDDDLDIPISESRLTAAVEAAIIERDGKKSAAPQASKLGCMGSTASSSTAPTEEREVHPPSSPTGSMDSFEDPPLAEELPAVGPPMSVVCPASMPSSALQPGNTVHSAPPQRRMRQSGEICRERHTAAGGATTSRTHKFCESCVVFFDTGVGETYAMLSMREGH